MKSIAILLNPSSGRKSLKKKKYILIKNLEKYNLSYDLFISKSEEHLRELVREKSLIYKSIVAVGGDSTVMIVLNEMLSVNSKAKLGLIGLGSSNDLMKEYGILNIEDSLTAIQNNQFKEIDIACIQNSKEKNILYYLGQANIGIGVEVNKYVAQFKIRHPILGKLQTIIGIMGIFHSFKQKKVPITLNINIDNKQNKIRIEEEVISALFSKIKYWATGKKYIPQAKVDDRQIHLVMIKKSGVFTFLKTILSSNKGLHITREQVETYSSKKISIHAKTPFRIQIDGDILLHESKPVYLNTAIFTITKEKIKVYGNF